MSDIQQLIAGFRQFHKDYFLGDQALFTSLSQGQKPSTLVIACSDSRVDPAIVMNAKPGDLFVVRNVVEPTLIKWVLIFRCDAIGSSQGGAYEAEPNL